MLQIPFKPTLRHGETMPRLRSFVPSLSSLSATSLFSFLLLTLLACLFSTTALAQGSSKKPLSEAEGNERDHAEKRAEWNMRGREAPKGESAAALRLRAHQQKMAMRSQRAAAERAAATANGSSPQVTTWVNLGPAPLASDATGDGSQDYNWVSGRATSVVIDPSDATGNTVLLGGAYGGLWRSTNAGSKSATPDLVTWQSLIDDQPTLAVGAIALQPGNSSVILVGTGETNSSGDSYYGLGMFRSTDGGTTWTQIQTAASGQSFVGVGFSKIAFSTSNTNLVVASTAGNIGLDFGLEQDGNSTARGIYYSTDAGATWNRVSLSDSAVPASVTGVVYNPSVGATGTFYAAIRRHGIYSSTDGQHFARLTTQPTPGLASANCPANSNASGCGIYRAEFAVTPGRNETYVWVVDATTSEIDDGIWKSVNDGTAWTQIPDTGITNCGSGGGSDSSGCGVQQGTYNLELAAVPNGTATDLYAGTINLYKCHVASGASACSTIDANVPNNWINLTHVYGCSIFGELAHVHPDQHGLAFMVVGGKSPGYFAHDGGISRTLDGYTGLNTGSCTGTNQFDSLSQTLGSMTEFVSFSVHPNSADILLGGTQDNGTPQTATATTSTTWQNALSGDGGYNVINPGNPTQWFASNPGSIIGICESGTSCNDQNFFLEAAPPNTIQGFAGNIDPGAFYTPYILDPQSTGEMLIGTCRVWRGATNPPEGPGTFIELSNNFDNGSTAPCTGNEINQVAGLAAGGPTDANGFSKVIYATTWGYGPLLNQGTGGEVWVTTNAPTLPTNVTGSINPSHYAIAAVAIDTSVASGQTAYVGIMGFHVSHVFKTANAGASWTDWTGSGATALPDAPVSSLLVDPAAGLVYAGTDVGLFSSPTSGSAGVWTEVGPPASSGSGFLPSAPVTAIRIFSNGTTKELRVSTYGRGIWQFDLAVPSDFTNVISNTPQTIFPTQTATFNGTLTSQGGYNSPVNLTCTGTAPTTCTPAPTPLTPTTGGAAYTVTAGGTVGDYSFNAHAVGTDAGTTTHDAAITLHVVDFALTAPSPNTLNVVQGSTSNSSTFVVSASGSFAGSVALSCPTGLPTGAACAFSPSATVSPTSSTPVTVTLTVTATGTTPVGNTTVTLSANTSGAPAAKTQTFALHVTAPVPSFTLGASPSSLTVVPAGLGVTSTITVTGQNGFNGSVSLAASSLPTGVLAAFAPNPTTTTSTLTLTASASAVPGAATVTITGTSGALTASVMIPLTIVQSFPLPGTLTNPAAASPGQSTSTTMLLAPFGGGNFTSNVTYTASGLPAGATVAFSPTQINSGTGSTSVTITVQTAGPFTGTAGGAERGGNRRKVAQNRPLWLPLTMPLAGIVLVGLFGRGIGRRYQGAGLCIALLLIGFLVACGSGFNDTVVTVSPNSVSTLYPSLAGAPAQTQQFSATVSNTTSQSVTWAVSGGAANGTIDQTGLYTAPATLPNPNSVTVTATSTATTTPGSATVDLKAPTPAGNSTVTVSVTEGTVTKMTTFTLTVN